MSQRDHHTEHSNAEPHEIAQAPFLPSLLEYGGRRLRDYVVKHLSPYGVPVLSTDHTLLKVTEMLVQLGLSQSKRTYPKPRQIYDFEVTARVVDPELPAR